MPGNGGLDRLDRSTAILRQGDHDISSVEAKITNQLDAKNDFETDAYHSVIGRGFGGSQAGAVSNTLVTSIVVSRIFLGVSRR